MTDREMLELAARAAGYVVESHHISGVAWVYPAGEVPDADGDYPGLFLWNPRGHDGDALRLAVKVGIGIFPPKVPTQAEDFAVASLDADIGQDTWFQESVVNGDPYAATRLAITRAAAEIGRQMEVTK